MSRAMIGAALLGMLTQGAFHYFLWRRLVRDTALRGWWRRGATIAIVALWIAIPLTMWLNRAGVVGFAPVAGWIAFPWMALCGLTVMLLLAVDAGRVLGWLVTRARGRSQPMDPGRRLALARITGGVALAAGGVAVAAGTREALGEVTVRTIEVPLPGLPAALDGFTIAQVTDVHVGMTIGRGFVEELVARVNAIGADLIAVTGDLVDGTVAELGDRVAPMAGLRAPEGVYFVTGNHEYYSGVEPWIHHVVAQLGMRHLRNQHVVIRGGFTLAGVDDHTGGRFGRAHGPRYDDAMAGRDPALPVVLLAHQPRQVPHAIRHGVALQLSGHTHGGQIWPWHYVVSMQQGGRVAGLYHERGTTLFVCRGAGYWGPPVRLGAPPEIGRIVLRAGSVPA